jgi:hypothetical protein
MGNKYFLTNIKVPVIVLIQDLEVKSRKTMYSVHLQSKNVYDRMSYNEQGSPYVSHKITFASQVTVMTVEQLEVSRKIHTG